MLDSGEVNYGARVRVDMPRTKCLYIFGLPIWTSYVLPTQDGRDITHSRIVNRQPLGTTGRITGFSAHGKLRVVTHDDNTEAIYWFSELSFCA